MRCYPLLVLAVLLGGAVEGRAQAQAAPNGWSLALGGEALRFSSAARDTAGDPEAQASLRPTQRLGLSVALARRIGAWEPSVELGWASGHVEAVNSAAALSDRSLDMSRLRFAPMLARRLTGLGQGEVLFALGPAFDVWSVDEEVRLRLGPVGRIALRVGVGPVELENRIAFGISGSPIILDDVPEGVTLRSLRTLTFGTAFRIPL